jgi:hypothetical protein
VVLVRQFLMQELILLTEHSPCSPCGCLWFHSILIYKNF